MTALSSLGLTLTLYACGLTLVCAGTAVAGGRRPRAVVPALVVLQVGLVLQAVLDGAELLRGHGAERAVNLAYLLTSLAVLPVVAGVMRGEGGRWGSAGPAVGCLLVAVVVVRLHQTLDMPQVIGMTRG